MGTWVGRAPTGPFDTSVLVAVFYGDHEHHAASLSLFRQFTKAEACCGAHTLAEIYSTLTRMPGKYRVTGDQAMLFVGSVLERLSVIALSAEEYATALNVWSQAGVTGGTIYDALLTSCALKRKPDDLFVNLRDAIADRLAAVCLEEQTFLGGDLSKLASVKRTAVDVAAYVGLHIEQGGNLDREKIDIGVVDGIVGIGQWEVTAEGVANHAGTTAMSDRHDSLRATARYIDMVNRVITTTPGRQVGTVGRVQAFPGAPNVIPGKVVFTLEIRDLTRPRWRRCQPVCAPRLRPSAALPGAHSPMHRCTTAAPPSAIRVKNAIETSASGLGLSARHLPSGPAMTRSTWRASARRMIFVPSVNGISHAPNEFTKPQDVVNGGNVLLHTILALDTAALT